jgi:hypothetical protein
MTKIRLNCEVYGDRIPCGDLCDRRVTEVTTNFLNVGHFEERPKRRFSLVPGDRDGGGGGADEGIQVLNHTHHLCL